jgi:hypothetical protein
VRGVAPAAVESQGEHVIDFLSLLARGSNFLSRLYRGLQEKGRKWRKVEVSRE